MDTALLLRCSQGSQGARRTREGALKLSLRGGSEALRQTEGRKQLYAGSWRGEKKVGFVVFANFHSVNALTRSKFAVPVCHRSSGVGKGSVQLAPAGWYRLALEPLGGGEATAKSKRKRRISLGREEVRAGRTILGREKYSSESWSHESKEGANCEEL